ncbi:hypothetical protein MPSEU_000325000 [Mayamaea pseudoterrestris]|nr:hypothetical protein MPSEU_000325000 [Mayamaea pseudoterrestris]
MPAQPLELNIIEPPAFTTLGKKNQGLKNHFPLPKTNLPQQTPTTLVITTTKPSPLPVNNNVNPVALPLLAKNVPNKKRPAWNTFARSYRIAPPTDEYMHNVNPSYAQQQKQPPAVFQAQVTAKVTKSTQPRKQLLQKQHKQHGKIKTTKQCKPAILESSSTSRKQPSTSLCQQVRLDPNHSLRINSTSINQQPLNNAILDLEFNTKFYLINETSRRLARRRTSGYIVIHAEQLVPVPCSHLQTSNWQMASTYRSHAKRSRSTMEKCISTRGELSTTSTTRIGHTFQCAIPPRQVWGHVDVIPTAGGTCVWDPAKAEQAKSNGQPIDEFMGMDGSLELQMLKMEALHATGYSVQEAKRYLLLHAHVIDAARISLTNEEGALFQQLVFRDLARGIVKDFHRIAQIMDCSLNSLLIHYYSWKVANPHAYHVLKTKSGGPDECAICGDGGELLLCDNCNKAFHWKTCLPMPIDTLPTDDDTWYCCLCIQGSPAKLRRLQN